MELKTDFTQAIDDAILQYKHDRLPVDPKTNRKEPLLSFKRGAVVHFAMSDSEIAMCTELKGDKSFFLPFNKGNDGHAGNKPRDELWREVVNSFEKIIPKSLHGIKPDFVSLGDKTKSGQEHLKTLERILDSL